MSQTDPRPVDQDEQNRQIWRGLGRFIDRMTPWLLEVGVWIFGSLIAFNLLILTSLFTIGPVATAVKVATAAFALALPLNLTGLFLLRLVQELKGAGFENELVKAFQEEGFVSEQMPVSTDLEAALTSVHKRRTTIVLRSSSIILTLSLLLTLTGLVATLWYMTWWIAVSFCVMAVVSLVIVIVIMAASQLDESGEIQSQKAFSKNDATAQAGESGQKKEGDA